MPKTYSDLISEVKQTVKSIPLSEVKRRLDAKELTIVVDQDLAKIPAGLAGFDSVLKDPRRLSVRYQPSRARVAEILAAVQAAGLEIVDLSTLEADLEDIFLQLTRGDRPAERER